MARLIETPTKIAAPGTPAKTIEEFVGRANTGSVNVSVARMVSPGGWSEPGQRPTFAEFTVVLRGTLVVETEDRTHRVSAGRAIMTDPGEWVRYATPDPDGAEYIAVCLPAFSPETVHRDPA